MDSGGFKYTAEQWACIVEAAGSNAARLDREGLEQLADIYRFHQKRIRDPKMRKRRLAEIAAFEHVRDLATSSETREQLSREIAVRRRYNAPIKAIRPAAQPTISRELMMRRALIEWVRVRRERPSFSGKDGRIYGPCPRFVMAVKSH
ncbi:hypothetical protein [Bosea lupini]|uniref:hypothetical protein n=1 Tax=Bosea lupini TaxID=1036779 RepID=UPI000B81E8F0|nr:hypothetical protein [Bosea lupini]